MTIDSEIRAIFRSHLIMIIGKWTVLLSLASISGIALWLFLPAQKQSSIFLLLIFVMIFLGATISSFIHWQVNTDIVTERKLISIRFHGLFRFHVEEVELRRIQTIDQRQEGLLQNIFAYGSVHISSEILGQHTYDIVLKNVWPIEKIISTIKQQCEICRQHNENF